MADELFDAGQTALSDDFIKLNSNSNFGIVRKEFINMGYYRNGDGPPATTSPVDAADIDGKETIFIPIYAAQSSTDANYIPGQVNFPSLLPYTHGRPLVVPYQHFFDQTNGKMVENFYAFDTTGQNAQVFDWGVSLVFAICQRLGIFLQGTISGTASGTATGGGGSGTGGTSGSGGAGSTPPTGTFGSGSVPLPTATISLAPANAGNFTVAHGLSATPSVIGDIEMTTDGEIWFQNPAADDTNLYLTASFGGITGSVDLWL